jgi:septal ring factor EnvC (AmiA/AmiB activator)
MLTPGIVLPAAVFAAVLVFLIVRARLPFLRVVPSPVEHAAQRRADDAEKELERANALIDHLSAERDALLKERSLATVIELVEKVSHGVDQTLKKLGELNGGLRHTAEALERTNETTGTITKAVELLASQIIIDVRGRE